MKGQLKVVNSIRRRKRNKRIKPEHYKIEAAILTTMDMAKATGLSHGFFRDLVNIPFRGYVIPPYHLKGEKRKIQFYAEDAEKYLVNAWGIKVTNPFKTASNKTDDDAAADDNIEETDLVINKIKRVKGSRLLEPTTSDETCRLINSQSTSGDDFFISIPLVKLALKHHGSVPTTIELDDGNGNIIARMDIGKFKSLLSNNRVEVRNNNDEEYVIVDKNWKFK